MILTRISVSQPVFATMVMLAMVVVGAFSYMRLPVENLPDVDFPVVAVVTSYPGATPEAVEHDVIKPIEDAVSTMAGIDTIESTARTGSAMIIIQFDLEVDSQVAAQDVRDKVAQMKAALPDNAEDPLILRFDPSELPVISIGISSERLDIGALTRITEDVIAKRIANIRGVGRASVVGGRPRQVRVDLDPDRLTALGVGASDVALALAAENQDLPAGALTDSRASTSVQVEGRLKALRDFEDVIVARKAGLPIRLGDVARVSLGLAERNSLAMLDGKDALSIDVVKTQGANTVDVAARVKKAVAEMSADDAFAGISIEILRDNAKPVVDSFHSVQNMIVEGAALATFIVFLFLNSWRSTVITGLTLPISIIGTMTAIHFLGFTLNLMSLLALSLAVGILIDDAIVVRENIMRHLNMGKSHRRAAIEGTAEIGLAVLATTLSIVAVFLPVAFMSGILGRFFLQFGVTVSVAVMISLFVSFTLDPMLSSVWYDPAANPKARRGFIGRLVGRFDAFFMWVGDLYAALLRKALKFRKTTLAIATAAFAVGIWVFTLVGAEFVPPPDNGEFQVDLSTPVGTSIERTAEKIAQVDALLRAEFPEVVGTYATINSGTSSGDNKATIIVRLVPEAERTRTPSELTGPAREVLKAIPGATFIVGASNGMGPARQPVELKILGPDIDVLARLAADLKARLEAIDGLVDISTTLDDPQPTLGIRIDRDVASDLGVSLQSVGDALKPMLGGRTVSQWTSPQGDAIDVVVRLPEELRRNAEVLGALPIATRTGAIVRLDQIAEVVASEGAGEINRTDRDRAVKVSASLDGVKLGSVNGPIAEAVAALDLPLGYRVETGGEGQNMAESMQAAGAALVLAVIFIYLVLASQFGSFLQPFAIMSSLPLALVGVALGLLAFGSTLNLYSIIGFIMLMGLVTKNAILLVDNANQRRREGLNLYDALVVAGRTRFRPIVMTTLAMIFGMLPLALNLHGGSGQNISMAHAVIGGLISSSLLTLVVVPVLLTYTEALARRVGRWLPKAPDDDHLEEKAAAPAE
ncbi:MAG: efflux RND transporter permease subunit [Alphaproteobacteria bacterium]|nr:MAG: efflux RND transporter permease subunit [Alphaproteobacteria bacterium]